MKKKNKYTILIIIGIICLLLVLFIFTISKQRNLTFIEKSVKDISLFTTNTIGIPFRFAKEKIDKKTVNQNDKYRELESNYKEKEKRIKELEQLLDLKNNLSDYTSIEASVINRNIGYWYQQLTIDKGTSSGIKEDMAVVTSKGLIGKIVATTKYYSTVKLLTSLNNSFQISVKITSEDHEIYGVLSGYDTKKQVFQMDGISENTNILENSIVTTTGLDSIFPSGIEIGTVSSIEKDHFDLAQTVFVKPSGSCDDIYYVSVLRRKDS